MQRIPMSVSNMPCILIIAIIVGCVISTSILLGVQFMRVPQPGRLRFGIGSMVVMDFVQICLICREPVSIM